MIKLLIVEDELITRKGLIRHIPWKKLGIDELESAENAREALRICREFQPDIVLSDIRMRGMDGIEMCHGIRKMLPECQIIFVSGYSNKEYLKAAISLGAVHYVEKPVVPSELIQAVEKALEVNRRIQENKSLEQDFSESLAFMRCQAFFALLTPAVSDENLEKALSLSRLWNDTDSEMRICIVRTKTAVADMDAFREACEAQLRMAFEESGRSDAGFCCHGEFLDATMMVLLLSGGQAVLDRDGAVMRRLELLARHSGQERRCTEEAKKRGGAKKEEGCGKARLWDGGDMGGTGQFWAFGNSVDAPQKLYESYRSAQEAGKCLSYKGYHNCAYASEPCADRYFEVEKQEYEAFSQALLQRDREKAADAMTRIYDGLIAEKACLNSYVRSIYVNLNERVKQARKLSVPTAQVSGQACAAVLRSGNGETLLDRAATIGELHDFVIRNMEEALAQDVGEENPSRLINRVIELIHKNYQNKDFCIRMLAEQVYLTPAYLSGLFKRKTGGTINQYLTNLRMEHAKALLQDPSLKLYQVAGQVGYEDPAYFAKIFKNQTGLTPSEYKEKKIP